MTAPSAATEVVEIREIEQSHAWQDFRLSGMPRLISAMHLCHAIHALAGTGMLARLRAGANTIGSGLLTGLSEKIGTGLLRYLVLNGVLEDTADGLSLTRRGELLTSDVSLARLGIYVGAYSPVTSRLTDLLSGSARYDVDVQRNGGELGRHCATLFSAFHTGILMEAIRGRGVHCVLDIGCGAGLLCEPLTRLGAQVIGVDPSASNIAAAKLHAEKGHLSIDYRCTTVEEMDVRERFDIVLAMEVVEHVTDVGAFISRCAAMLKPGGLMVVSTLNRNWKSFALAIVGAEYVLRWLPRGTHQWDKFVTPDELAKYLLDNRLTITEQTGVVYSPFADRWSLSSDVDVNYMVIAEGAV